MEDGGCWSRQSTNALKITLLQLLDYSNQRLGTSYDLAENKLLKKTNLAHLILGLQLAVKFIDTHPAENSTRTLGIIIFLHADQHTYISYCAAPIFNFSVAIFNQGSKKVSLS